VNFLSDSIFSFPSWKNEEPNMHVKWTHEAWERLADRKDYISKDRRARAIQFVNNLIEQGETLKVHSHIGRVVPELGNENIRE
jgi:plasmid stabilization system protein ParE